MNSMVAFWSFAAPNLWAATGAAYRAVEAIFVSLVILIMGMFRS